MIVKRMVVVGSFVTWGIAAAPAQPPDQAVTQNLLQRQQQLETYQLKGEQFQQLVQPGLNPQQKSELPRLHLLQQQNQQALQNQQVQRQSVQGQTGKVLPEAEQGSRLEAQSLQFQRERDAQLDDFAQQRREGERATDATAKK